MRFSPRAWLLTVFVSALVLAVFMQIPQLIHMADGRYKGVLVQLNSDEPLYLARVEESLAGRPSQAAEAITGEPGIKSSQPALIEEFEGTLFRATGWRAATV